MRVFLLLAALVVGTAVFLRMRTASEAAAATAEVAVRAEPKVDYSRWQELYADASLEQVRQELPLLRAQLDKGTLDYYEHEFTRGAYVVEGRYTPGEEYHLRSPGDDLCARRFLRTGEVTKVVLPRDEFPEMYELRDQIAWLSHREDELTLWGGNQTHK